MSRTTPLTTGKGRTSRKSDSRRISSSTRPKAKGRSTANRVSAAKTAVDINIVTYNSMPHLEDLIQSLADQHDDRVDVHLHFLDNSSEDGTVDRLRTLLVEHEGGFASTSIIESQRNLGFGRGHNRLAENGTAPYLFILNPDAVLPPPCLGRLIDAIEADRADPQIAAWEPRQTPYEHPKVYDPVTMEPSWCSGAGLLVRREAYDRIGGFDPRIFLYCEDVDLSWRLREAGYHLKYVPAATFVHNSYADAGEIKPQQFIHSRLGNVYLRIRFGRWSDVLTGLMLYCAEIFGSQNFPGQRRRLLGGLLSIFRNFPYFRMKGRRGRARYRFHGLNFSIARDGAFHEVVTADELPAPPKVSVLIRTVGRQPMLRRALTSVANQTYPNVEVIVVEDGPATLEAFLHGFATLDVVYHPMVSNQGRCEAGNQAMRLATGDYLVFLDEDDEFYADHIEQLVMEVLKSGKAVAYATSFEVPTRYGPDCDIVAEGFHEVVHRKPFSRLLLCQGNYLPILAVLFHRSLFEECGGFDPELDRLEDWDLWLRFAGHTDGFAFLDKTTSLYRVPFDYDREKDRRDELREYQALVREKRNGDRMTMTVGEIVAEMDESGGENYNIGHALRLNSQELRAIYEIYRRFRIFQWGVQLAIFVVRKVTGR